MTNSAPVFTAGGGSDDAFTRVSTSATGAQADGASVQAAFSPDGTKVAFASYADNLVPGDTNGAPDVFVKDLSTGAITLVSTDASGVQLGGYQPIFSPDGTKLAFATGVDIFVKDLATGALTRVSTSASGEQADGLSTTNPIFSPDGTKVAFYSDADNLVPDDTDHVRDIFVKDLTTGAITLIAPSPYNGGPGGGGLENGFTSPPLVLARWHQNRVRVGHSARRHHRDLHQGPFHRGHHTGVGERQRRSWGSRQLRPGVLARWHQGGVLYLCRQSCAG
ncbi:TolB family protein [Bradyrhizobium sp. 1050_B9_N1_2]|uniref:TolB family protein n=1 Tax=unclassified Bradyrhizobium TaxID=2631580 RepID=UPI003394B7E0